MTNCIVCGNKKFCPSWKAIQVEIRDMVTNLSHDECIQICQLPFAAQSRYNVGELNAGMEMAGNCSNFKSPLWKK